MGTSANVLLGPGLWSVAPLGTTEPTDATTALDAAFRAIGYTEDGSTFTYELTNEAIEVAEEFDPIKYKTTKRAGTVSLAMAEATRRNFAMAMNMGAAAATSGALEPPAPGAEIRIMGVWQSDDGARWLFRQLFINGKIEIANKKAPAKRLLPIEMRLEKPTGVQPFKVFPDANGNI